MASATGIMRADRQEHRAPDRRHGINRITFNAFSGVLQWGARLGYTGVFLGAIAALLLGDINEADIRPSQLFLLAVWSLVTGVFFHAKGLWSQRFSRLPFAIIVALMTVLGVVWLVLQSAFFLAVWLLGTTLISALLSPASSLVEGRLFDRDFVDHLNQQQETNRHEK